MFYLLGNDRNKSLEQRTTKMSDFPRVCESDQH